MRSFVAILLVIILTLSLTSCDKKTQKSEDLQQNLESSELESAIESEKNGTSKIPTEKDISEDLIENEINCFELNYSVENLKIDSLKIDKRKTDNATDVVYISTVFKNTYYKVEADLILYYSFYTEGGWLLDDYEIIDYQSFANCPYYTDKEFSNIINTNFENGKITNREQYVDDNGIYYDNITFVGNYDYYYATAIVTCSYTMYFIDNVWESNCYFEDVSIDWSRMKGKYVYTNSNFSSGTTHLDVNLTVSIDEIEQLQNPEEYGYKTGGIRFTYSGHSWVYSKSNSEVITDEDIVSKTKTAKTTIITQNVMGMKLDLPVVIDTVYYSIFVPFYPQYPKTAKLSVIDGVYSSELEYGRDVFKKVS